MSLEGIWLETLLYGTPGPGALVANQDQARWNRVAEGNVQGKGHPAWE